MMKRLKYPELRNLQRSTRFTSIQWRNQTPGSLGPLFSPTVYDRDKVVDPSHPAAGIPKLKFPFVRNDDISIRLLPMGLLLREFRPFPATPILTWTERVQKAKEAGLTGNRKSNAPNVPGNSSFDQHSQLYPERDYNSLLIPPCRITPRGPFLNLALERAVRRVPMSFHISTSKKRMGQFRYMRRRIEKRIRAAINLIVTKGAHTRSSDTTIQFDANDAGRKWVLQGWAYMFIPTNEIYNMPYTKLIDNLRTILQHVNEQAIWMENVWLNRSLLNEQLAANLEAPTENIVPPHTTTPIPLAIKPNQKDIVERPCTLPTPISDPPNVSSMIYAGKEPEIWKQELLAGLDMIAKRQPQDLNSFSVKRSVTPLSLGGGA